MSNKLHFVARPEGMKTSDKLKPKSTVKKKAISISAFIYAANKQIFKK
jgi:hypothetical protein